MKIAIVTSSFPRFQDDYAGVFVYELAKNLVHLGVQVHVLAPHDKKSALKDSWEGLTIHRFRYVPYSIIEPALCYGSGIPINLKRSRSARLQVPAYIASLMFSLRRLVASESIQIINSHWLLPQGVISGWIRRYLGIPHICTVHANEASILSRIPLGRQISRYAIRNTDCLICVSKRTKQRLENVAGIPITAMILPMGISLQRFHNIDLPKQEARLSLSLKGDKILLFVGRLEEMKGIHYLLPAYAQIRAKWNNSMLCIIGTGQMESELKQQAKNLGLDQNVCFLGRIPNEKLPLYYRSADLVVIPSIVAQGGDEEGMPVVLLEALAAGCRIVTTTTGGAVEIIRDGHNGFLAAPADVESLSIAMTTALSTPMTSIFQQSIQETAQAFDWPKVAAFYHDIATQLTGTAVN